MTDFQDGGRRSEGEPCEGAPSVTGIVRGAGEGDGGEAFGSSSSWWKFWVLGR